VIVLAAHVEEKCQATVGGGIEHAPRTYWEPVPDTYHRTGDVKSENAKRAHEILANFPDRFREVKDRMGRPCTRAK